MGKKQPNRKVALICLSIGTLLILMGILFSIIGLSCVNRSCNNLPTNDRNDSDTIVRMMIITGFGSIVFAGIPYLILGIGLWKSKKWGQIGAIIISSFWALIGLNSMRIWANLLSVIFIFINLLIIYFLTLNKNIRKSYS